MANPTRDRPSSADRPLSLARKARLYVKVWLIAAKVQLALWRTGLPAAAAVLGPPAPDRRYPVPLASRAVSRTLRIGPWRPRCLVRSLVLYRLLRAQGDPAELVIGLKERATSSDAHAWVELEGRDVGPIPGGRGYSELTRYPAPAVGADGTV